eukprot:UN04513
MLSIETASTRIASGDDDGNCGTRTVLENLSLDQGVEHFIVLVGYGGVTGAYRVELSCQSDSEEPTGRPTLNPSMEPTLEPSSEDPTVMPTIAPTFNPIVASTKNPSREPTACPTTTPTFHPTPIVKPTGRPTLNPSMEPTLEPSSEDPTVMPTISPTFNPIVASTKNPSREPTACPTTTPTFHPTLIVSTNNPTEEPSEDSTTTLSPTVASTDNPTEEPTTHPSTTLFPTFNPTIVSTNNPTREPTLQLTTTFAPTSEPSDVSTLEPTLTPSSALQTLNPTSEPSNHCISDLLEIRCGQVLTGSTVNACEGQRRFSFVPESDSRITVSACDSEFDTILAFYNSYTISTFSDDSHQCGLQSILEDVSVEAGREYDILLTGYDNQVGSYRIELTCDSDMTSTTEPYCEDEFIEVQCGDVISGSTVGSCNGEQLFLLTAETESTTISSCDSQFDTMLGLSAQTGEMVAFTDDTQECGRQSRLDGLFLTIGNTYTVALSGFGGEVGAYTISITCSNPTLDPTSEPTSLTPQISYGCMFGCEASYTSCHWKHVLDQPCTRDSSCDFDLCQSFCDENAHCQYFFRNNQGTCYLYDDCSRARLTSYPGFNRQNSPKATLQDLQMLILLSSPIFTVA